MAEREMRTHPHPRGHHPGGCTKACRAGRRSHPCGDGASGRGGPVKYDIQDSEGNRVVGTYYPPGDPPPEEHLYRQGAEPSERRKFEREYGKKKGDYVYGATVGKVKREREAKR
jgi:hypothetical protein